MSNKATIINSCVCCGAAIPEGRHVCPRCEYNAGQQLYKRLETLNAKLRDGRLVEVVRCKDCRHSDDIPGGRFCKYGVCVECEVEDDFFCRDGERKEKTDDDGH